MLVDQRTGVRPVAPRYDDHGAVQGWRIQAVQGFADRAIETSDQLLSRYTGFVTKPLNDRYAGLTVNGVDRVVNTFSDAFEARRILQQAGLDPTQVNLRVGDLSDLMSAIFNNLHLYLPDRKYGPPLNGREDVRRGWQYEITAGQPADSDGIELIEGLQAQVAAEVDLDELVNLQTDGGRSTPESRAKIAALVWHPVKTFIHGDMRVLRRLIT